MVIIVCSNPLCYNTLIKKGSLWGKQREPFAGHTANGHFFILGDSAKGGKEIMLVTYDPKVQGNKLTEEEIERISELNPEFTSFSVDEPELTDELLQRMRSGSAKPGRFLKTSNAKK